MEKKNDICTFPVNGYPYKRVVNFLKQFLGSPEEMVWGLWQRSTEFMARSNCRLSCRLGQVEVTEGVVGNGDDGLLLEAQPASDEATASPADTCPCPAPQRKKEEEDALTHWPAQQLLGTRQHVNYFVCNA